MRYILTILLCLSFSILNAQILSQFRGKLNIYSSTGTAPNFTINGYFQDDDKFYTSDSIQVNDIIYVANTTRCAKIRVTAITSKTGGIFIGTVQDLDNVLTVGFKGVSGIVRPTTNKNFPVLPTGLPARIEACMITDFARMVDTLAGSAISGVDLSYTPSPTNGIVSNTQGNDATIPPADGTNAGLLLPGEKTTIGNAVVTTGSYNDPAWLTGLEQSKILSPHWTLLGSDLYRLNTNRIAILSTGDFSLGDTTYYFKIRGSTAVGASIPTYRELLVLESTDDALTAPAFRIKGTNPTNNLKIDYDGDITHAYPKNWTLETTNSRGIILNASATSAGNQQITFDFRGKVYTPPTSDDVRGFKITGGTFNPTGAVNATLASNLPHYSEMDIQSDWNVPYSNTKVAVVNIRGKRNGGSFGGDLENLIWAKADTTTRFTLTYGGRIGNMRYPQKELDIDGSIQGNKFSGKGTSPGIAVNTSFAGTGATASITTSTSSDVAGNITIVTGSADIAEGVFATVTYNSAYVVAPVVHLQPTNREAAANYEDLWVQYYTDRFEIHGSADLELITNLTMTFGYVVIQPK